ncbi:hypothetical protein J4734_17255 [Klebsiella pneumoniae]|uniref:Uncharacterized protein n=1 Tax=Klebsiella pneumoniae TaxID=573 RepID=A0A939NRB7_KLEPN|nr:hypothetical protein [Klebsiella pneumoniae]
MFCRDAASARPEACRDKSKGRAAAILPEPGVQGAAATGRPCALPAPCRITQTINRERKLR